MAGIKFTTKFSTRKNRFSQIAKHGTDDMEQTVLRHAAAIQERAKQLAARDTGAMSESIYHSDGGENSDYLSHATAARALNPDAEILDEVTPEFAISLSGSNENEYAVVVGVAVDYAIFQEEGTRHMAAHPFMRPSILAEEPDFINDMGKLGGRLI